MGKRGRPKKHSNSNAARKKYMRNYMRKWRKQQKRK